MAGTNIALKTTAYNKASDKSWLGTRKGLQDMRSITLDISTFDAEHIENGYLPSGIALGEITATGKYGPYDPTTPAADGRENMAGLLFEEVKVEALTDADCGAALFWNGVVKKSRLPNFTGTGDGIGEVDAGGEADVTTIRWEA